MNILENIINELIDKNISLSSPFLKTKVLATRADNKELLQWVNNELEGYDDLVELPEYRIHKGEGLIDYINGRWKLTKQALPLSIIPESIRSQYDTFNFRHSIESLEGFIVNKNERILSMNFTAEETSYVQTILQNEGNPMLQIIQGYKRISINSIIGILSHVRSRLLDFMLKIESQFGAEVDIKTLKANSKEIITIMNQTINNIGDGNVVTTGSNSNNSINVSIKKFSKDDLISELKKNLVEQSNIDELVNVIDKEHPSGKSKFGKKVQNWISKMLAKTLDGSWEVTTATAAGVLTEIINKYYGL